MRRTSRQGAIAPLLAIGLTPLSGAFTIIPQPISNIQVIRTHHQSYSAKSNLPQHKEIAPFPRNHEMVLNMAESGVLTVDTIPLNRTQEVSVDEFTTNSTCEVPSHEVTAISDAAAVSISVSEPSDQVVVADVDEESVENLRKKFSYKELVLFISTTVIIWLSEPLLSLVDTTIVGKFSPAATSIIAGVAPETLQLAALGPAAMLCDNAAYLTYFLAIATTNQLAVASAKNDDALQVKTTSDALGVACIMGVMITLTIFLRGDALCKYFLGGGAIFNGVDITSTIIPLSWLYAKIRGFMAPLTIMGWIAQAVCLATRDTRTPAIAVLAASIINVFGDLLLVAKFRMGIGGAAIATAAASFVSSIILMAECKKKVERWKASEGVEDNRPFISIPDAASFISLAKLAGPIFFVILGKMVCYSAMTLKASSFGMMSMTTQNIMLRVFFFFCIFGDSFSMAAQSFLPSAMFEKDNEESDEKEISKKKMNNKASRFLLKRIFLLASSMAVINTNTSRFVMKRGGSFFTNDGAILSLLRNRNRVALMMGSCFLHPFIMAMEGSILATRDLGFLVSAYGFTMATMLSILKFSTSTFTGVWQALFAFQAIRFTIFGGRVLSKTRASKAE